MTVTSTLPSDVGSALSLQELAHSWEQTPFPPNHAEHWRLLVTSATNHAAQLRLGWALVIQEGEVWELDWYIQRVRTVEFLAATLVDTLQRIRKMTDRLRGSGSELYDAAQAAIVDTDRRAIAEIVQQAREILAKLKQPGPPVNYEAIQRLRERPDYGHGEFLDDMIARVTAGGGVVKE